MNFTPDTPLTQNTDGTIRVTGSRVTIDSLVARYLQGDAIEAIHEGFPSVSPQKIENIVNWYLANRTEVDEYIRKQDREAEIIRREIESQPANRALREKLMRRKAELTKV